MTGSEPDATKIIFLDVDGVLTSARDNGFRDFNLHVVHWLRWACETAPAKIVLSSTWRYNHDKEFWQTIFGDVVHDDWMTPDGDRQLASGIYVSCIRGDEVAMWLENHPEVTSYVILDDDSDFRNEQKPHLIKTDGHNGMLWESFLTLREMLGLSDFPKADRPIYQHPNFFGVTRNRNHDR